VKYKGTEVTDLHGLVWEGERIAGRNDKKIEMLVGFETVARRRIQAHR
jgi:hypothetical protein